LYLLWIILSLVSVPLAFTITSPDNNLKAVVYNLLLFVLLYAVFIAVLSTVLYLSGFTIPISIMNDVKTKQIAAIIKRVATIKEMLKTEMVKSYVAHYLYAGKHDFASPGKSVDQYLKTNFPDAKFIKTLLEEEIIGPVEAGVVKTIADLEGTVRKSIKNNEPVKIHDLANTLNIPEHFLAQLLKQMLGAGMIAGHMTELDQDFIPEGFMAPGPVEQVPKAVIVNQAATSAGDKTELNAPAFVESEGTPNVPNIGRIKKAIEAKNREIEAARNAYESGEMGADYYMNKSEELETELEFLSHRLLIAEKLPDPTQYCMVCLRPILDAPSISCPNGHMIHVDCAHDFLVKFDSCPWCLERIKI
jgi:hypothetical protein